MVELEDDEEMKPKLENLREMERDMLEPIFLTLSLELGGPLYRQERERRIKAKVEGNEPLFPSKWVPRMRYFWGKIEAQLECTHFKEAGRLGTFAAGGRPATPHGRPARGQKGQ